MNQRLSYLRSLIGFAFQNNPLLYGALALSVFSVIIELAAVSSLMPLAAVAAGESAPVDSPTVRVLDWMGMTASGQTLLIVFVGLFSVRVLTQFASQGLIFYLSKRLLLQLSTRAFHTIMHSVPLKELERQSMGYFITLSGDEANRASNIIAYMSQFASVTLLAFLYFVAIVAFSLPVAVFVAVFLLVSFLALFNSFRTTHKLGAKAVEQSQGLHSVFVDTLNGLRSVRAFAAETYVSNNYYSMLLSYVRTNVIIEMISLTARYGPALLLLLAVCGVALWPSSASRFSVELPLLVTLIVLLMRFFPVTGQALNLGLRIIADVRAGQDVTHIINQYKPASPKQEMDVLETITRIEARSIDFSHLDGKPVLTGFDVSLEKGKSYALVGESGSGKSTFLDLLLCFYEPENGKLLVNSTALQSVPKLELRRRIALVAQEPVIFNDTVASNIQFGAQADREQIERACKVACIHEFILSLPEGYDTHINYRGSNLSGGQKQRIGIARAVLRQPDVLLLDESTSALDEGTRKRVVSNLLTEFQDRIILFVTHDAFVMGEADFIYAMDKVNQVCADTKDETVKQKHRDSVRTSTSS